MRMQWDKRVQVPCYLPVANVKSRISWYQYSVSVGFVSENRTLCKVITKEHHVRILLLRKGLQGERVRQRHRRKNHLRARCFVFFHGRLLVYSYIFLIEKLKILSSRLPEALLNSTSHQPPRPPVFTLILHHLSPHAREENKASIKFKVRLWVKCRHQRAISACSYFLEQALARTTTPETNGGISIRRVQERCRRRVATS